MNNTAQRLLFNKHHNIYNLDDYRFLRSSQNYEYAKKILNTFKTFKSISIFHKEKRILQP
jgi:hypothetical protein